MPERSSSAALPVTLVLAAMTSMQVGAAVAKRLFPVVGSTGAASLRLLFGAAILCAVLRPWRLRLTAAAWRSVIVYGMALGGMNSLFYAALKTVPLGVGVALELTGPLAVALLASRRAVDFLWVGLAMGGLLLLLPFGGASAGVDPAGAAFALAAGACWGLYIVFGQKAGEGRGVSTAAVGMVVAAACVVPVGVAQAGASLFAPGVLPYALGVAVLSSALPYSLEMVALGRLPAKTFGTLMSLAPAVGALSGLVILQERLAVSQWLAVMLIVAASAGATVTAAREREAPHLSDPPR